MAGCKRRTHLVVRLQTELLLHLCFFLKLLDLLVVFRVPSRILRELVSRETTKFAVNPKLLHDIADTVTTVRMALSSKFCTLFAVLFGDLGVAIIKGVSKMAAGAPRLARQNVTGVDHDHLLPAADELIGGRDTRDAGSNDTDVGLNVLVQSRELRTVGDGILMNPYWVKCTRSVIEVLGIRLGHGVGLPALAGRVRCRVLRCTSRVGSAVAVAT